MDQASQYAHGVRSDEPRSEALRPESRASRQDIFLFTAPPVLSALVLATLCVHLPRIPSAHPLADAVLLCAGISAVLITLWWIVSFVCALHEARTARTVTNPQEPRLPRTPRIFRPLFMRRIVLTLGGTAIGLGAVFAPAHAAEASHTPAPTTSLMAPDARSGEYSTDGSSVAYPTEPTDEGNTTNAEFPLAPNTTESTGSPQDRSPFFAPSHEARGTYAYTVRAGDTLWSIAAEQLGEGTDASVIYDYTLDIYSANLEALGRNADLLYEGQVLQIPEQPLQTFRR